MRIPIFNIYQNELFYSALGRISEISGNFAYKKYLLELFDSSNAIPTIWFPGLLDNWEYKIPGFMGLTSDYIIYNHTLYPIYAPFASIETQKYVLRKMKRDYPRGIAHKIGAVAGGVCKKRDLYFCPECAIEEFEKLGQAYFHVLHQVEGVLICEKHMRQLMPYKRELGKSRLSFDILDKEKVMRAHTARESLKFKENLTWINEQFLCILDEGIKADKLTLHEAYLSRLKDMDLALPSGSIRQRDLHHMFVEKYSIEYLRYLESDIDVKNEYNWLRVIARNSKRSSHPLRHILFIGFLYSSVDDLIEAIKRMHKKFEKYPCLNPACNNYLKDVIDTCIITYDYSAKKTIGTFTCACGFTYSRNLENKDKYEIGRVKEFGKVWRDFLAQSIINGNSISQTARDLNCDKKTVIKYALLLGLGKYLNSKYKTIEDFNRMTYGNIVKKPSKIQVVKHQILYSMDISIDLRNKNRVDWEKRDQEIVIEIKAILPKLYREDRKTRVTKTMICNSVGKYSMINNNLNKLPMTKKLMEESTESLEDFQCFRINRVCEEMIENGESIKRWKIMRRAGLKEPLAEAVDDYIESI